MATSIRNESDESVVEVRKTEDSREKSDVSTSQSKNNVAHSRIDEISKQTHSQDDNNVSHVDDNSAIERMQVTGNLLMKNLNAEMVDGVTEDTEYRENRNENSTITSLIDQSKNNNHQAKAESIVGETVVAKRKRRLSSNLSRDKNYLNEDSENAKRKRQKNTNDTYCWRCHKDVVEANCSACPRSWHRKCMGGSPPTSTNDNWICGECASILQAENATTRSPTMAHVTVDQLCMVLKYVIERMRRFPGAEPFWSAVDLEEVPNYLDYVIKPMDLTLLESNVNSKLYGSTDAFMADAKWIQHNCIVFNTCGGVHADTSKLTNAAKQIIKIARQELSEIEACPDCYARGRNLPRPHPLWFIEPCRQPHLLIWAKLKGFPFWPAKALPRLNGQGHVDVRFFGEHDRAWVSPKDIYLYSRDPPTPLPRKKKQEMIECMREITQHCRKLEMTFGPFQFAPPRIQYNPHDHSQIKLIFPKYNPETLYEATKASHRESGMSSPLGKPSATMKISSPSTNETFHQNRSATTESESITDYENDLDESQSNHENHLREVGEYSEHKSRPKKPTSVRDQDNQMNKSKSSMMIEPPTKNTITVSPKNSTIRKTLAKKTPEAARNNSVHVKSISSMLQKVSPKNRPNHMRKVNATSTPLLAPSATRKITKPNIIRIYKPKARIVDKLNAETNEMNEDSWAESTNSQTSQEMQCTAGKKKSLPNASASQRSVESVGDSSTEFSISADLGDQSIISPQIQSKSNEVINSQKSPPGGKRQSKARKSFPNKPPPIRVPTQSAMNSSDAKVDFQTTLKDFDANYHLAPPEAGPLSSQLNRSANKLAVEMARLIEETIREAAESKIHDLDNVVDAHEATVYSLRLQMERMRWQHQQQLAELKYNTDQTLREMRASLEVERLRAIEEIRKEAEEERVKCIEETKSKQWCSYCGREALYYCCWNTAYCNHACQQMHWQTHMRKCTQKPTTVNSTPQNTQETNSAHQQQKPLENQQPQVMPRLVISAQQCSSNVRGA